MGRILWIVENRPVKGLFSTHYIYNDYIINRCFSANPIPFAILSTASELYRLDLIAHVQITQLGDTLIGRQDQFGSLEILI